MMNTTFSAMKAKKNSPNSVLVCDRIGRNIEHF